METPEELPMCVELDQSVVKPVDDVVSPYFESTFINVCYQN